MKLPLYLRYATRSLQRDRLRALLAVVCIAIGVMAMVALQLAGQMVSLSLLSNVRDLNGGDITIIAKGYPLGKQDLTFFQNMQNQKTIVRFSPIWSSLLIPSVSTLVSVVQPETYPVVSPPQWVVPTNGKLSLLLHGDQVVIDQIYATQQNKRIGDRFTVQTTAPNNAIVKFTARIAGIIHNNGHFATSTGLILISEESFRSLTHQKSFTYNALDLSTNNNAQHTRDASDAIKRRFPNVTTTTVNQVQRINQQSVNAIQEFLHSVGLLTLLIAGIGIMHSMQAFLGMRLSEIAVLKAVGYPRRDLYTLFSLETAILGLSGGLIGAICALVASFGFFILLQHLFSSIVLTFYIDPFIICEGPIIGIITAILFGWFPIVRAGATYPLIILKQLPNKEGYRANWLVNILLALLLSGFFCIMATVLLGQDWLSSVLVVYATIAVLLLLGLMFSLIVKFIGQLVPPERNTRRFWISLIILICCVVPSIFISLAYPVTGILLLMLLFLLCILLFLLPKRERNIVKMALRNLERQRFQTVTKLVVLFVGIFAIALVLIFGFNLRKQIQMLELLSYNLVIRVPQKDVESVLQKTKTLNGINQQTLQHRPSITVKMLRLPDTHPTQTNSYSKTQQPQTYSNAILEGFDLAHNLLPDASWVRLLKGRMLQPQDVHTHNVLLVSPNAQQALVGVTFTLKSPDGRQSLSATIVGIVSPQPHVPLQSTLLASQEVITQLNHSDHYAQTFYLSVDPDRSDETISTLSQAAPDSVFIMNTVSLVNIEHRFFNAAVAVLLALGSFAILAALAIIANTVALAMMEHRREIGILKAVGYSSKYILEIVLIENNVIAIFASFIALMIITFTLNLLTNVYKFADGFVVPWYLLPGIILGSISIVSLIVFIVASGINKMRPLDVLRYE